MIERTAYEYKPDECVLAWPQMIDRLWLPMNCCRSVSQIKPNPPEERANVIIIVIHLSRDKNDDCDLMRKIRVVCYLMLP